MSHTGKQAAWPMRPSDQQRFLLEFTGTGEKNGILKYQEKRRRIPNFPWN